MGGACSGSEVGAVAVADGDRRRPPLRRRRVDRFLPSLVTSFLSSLSRAASRQRTMISHGPRASVRCGAMSEPIEPPSETDLLFAYVRRRYADRLSAEQLEALRRSVEEVTRLTAALRAVKLDNADEPFQRFEAFRDPA
jgi:hypothetical protein